MGAGGAGERPGGWAEREIAQDLGGFLPACCAHHEHPLQDGGPPGDAQLKAQRLGSSRKEGIGVSQGRPAQGIYL